ncbi:MAG: Na(+)-translocating NADH-quinone reductase subunit F [Flavobacteriaceae bacterium]|nr:Na(+)-translocating NADH-quinone reductase subunit F [Flavobacteriaceae bacterium]
MKFSEEEIHYAGMNFIGEELQALGYEFLGVNSDLKKHPQFVIFKSGEPITFVMVKTVLYPDNFTALPDVSEKVVEHAKRQDSSVWFAGVALCDAENEQLPPSLGSPYKILFNGFKIVHTHE